MLGSADVDGLAHLDGPAAFGVEGGDVDQGREVHGAAAEPIG